MRILIAVTSHLSYKLIEGQLEYLVAQGNEVFFCSSNDEVVKQKVENAGAKFLALNLTREIDLKKDFVSLVKCAKLLNTVKPDLINASTPKAGLIFMIASFLFFKSKRIFTLRGIRSDTLVGLKKNIVTLFEKLTCLMAEKVIVISPSLRLHAIHRGIVSKEKAVVLGEGSSNGVNVNRFTITKELLIERDKLRFKYGISEDDFIVGYVGRIVKDKGIEELYLAYKEVKHNVYKKNVRLCIVGTIESDDPISSELLKEMKIDKDVIFISFVQDIEKVYTLFDVFVLVSYREGFGNVCIEASSMNLPIIVSNIPGLSDTVVNGSTGILVEPQSINDLADAIDFFISNNDFRISYGIQGRERVIKYFSNEYIWKLQYELYCSILNQ